MAMRDDELRKRLDALSPQEQLRLAYYLLGKSPAIIASEEALLSEHVLAREWLLPEEDEAWKNL